jgi:hypothetical protein
MSARTLFRLSGLILVLALVLEIVSDVLHPPSHALVDVLKATYGPAHIAGFASRVFVLLGLPGLYAWQSRRAGLLGLVGFVLVMVETAYEAYLELFEGYVTPLLAREPTAHALVGPDGPLAQGAGALGSLVFVLILGFPLFGVATMRAGILPRPVGWLLVATLPAMVLGLVLFMGMPDVLATLPMAIQPVSLAYYVLFVGYAVGGYALWTEKWRAQEAAHLDIPQPA